MAGLTEIEEVVEAVETVREENAGRLILGGCLIGLSVGLMAGWFGADKYLRTKYEQIAEDEITQMRDHFRQKFQTIQAREETKVEDLVKDARYTVGGDYTDGPGSPNVVQNGISPTGPATAEEGIVDDWDYEIELASRPIEDGIYVIHEDEQFEKQYNEVTLVYYFGDDVLAEESGRIIENPDEIIGDNLDKWGHGCSDPNMVYIRNDVIAADIELCRDTGSYAETVHGHAE